MQDLHGSVIVYSTRRRRGGFIYFDVRCARTADACASSAGRERAISKSNKRMNKAPSVFTRVIPPLPPPPPPLNIIINDECTPRAGLRRETGTQIKGMTFTKHNAERFSRSCVSAFGVPVKSFEIFEYI